RDLPQAVVEILAEEPGERPSGSVMDADRRIEDDAAATSPNTEVEFVVLVAPERLVEQADASKHVWRERAEREGVRLDSRRPVAGARPANAEHAGDPA